MAAEKYSIIAEELKTRILSGWYIDRFPAAVTLEAEYGVSSRTMAKVYARLKSEGLIETTPVGSFVSKEYQLPADGRVILLFINGPHQLPLAEDILYNTFRNEVKHAGFFLCLNDEHNPDYETLIKKLSPVGVAFAYSSWNPEAGMIFDKYNIPQIAMNWFGEQYNVDCVDGDWEYILDQLANQLVKRNYRKVGLQLNPERNSFISCRYQKNLSDWKKIIARYGITDYGNAWHNMMCDEPPEVIISFGEPVYKELHDFYSQRNLQLNIVNLNREIPEEKEICWRYVGFDYRVIAVEGWKMLNMLINKQQLPERRKLIKFPSRILFNNTQE